MLDPLSSRFWRAALQSGLLDTAGLQACWDAIPEEKRVDEHIDRRLARQSVQNGLLTLWQAQQIMAGRSSGFKIDRYVLIDLIGQGGMGRVYLARDTRLNRRVAVKILSPERVNNPRAIARFHREAMVGAQLQHEHLVRIYDEGESAGKCYLVMEFIEGKNIGQMIAENGPIPPAVAARLGRQVAMGLEHAQRKGLIHRDVNPYNILVTHDGQAKLTDLGLAIDLSENERVTRDGATVGTFDYISPEQARHSHGVDTRSDIYSLGCTLYHMLTGQVPFPSASLPEKLFGHQASEPEPIAKLTPGVPAGLAAVIHKTMRKSPADRYATPLELAQALEPFGDDSADPSTIIPDNTPQPAAKHATSITQVTAATQAQAAASKAAPPAAPVPAPEPTAVAPSAEKSTTAGSAPLPATAPSTGDAAFNLGLMVDLGPEPPLSGASSSKPKTRPKSKPIEKPVATSPAKSKVQTTDFRSLPYWIYPAGIAAVVLISVAGFQAYQSSGSVAPKGTGKSKGDTRNPSPGGRKGPKLFIPTTQGKEVVVVYNDGDVKVERDLVNGMRAAAGRGYVLLTSSEPVKIPATGAISIGGGRIDVRAGEGVNPVLQVEVRGGTPFLSTKTDAPLILTGVTIEARYVEPGPEPAPVIEAGSHVTLDRCAFELEQPAPGSSAVKLEGGILSASGCSFVNFDRAIDLACFGGTNATLTHCLMVMTAPGPQEALGGGWALRLRSMPGVFDKASRKVVLDHCTIKGQGVVAFEGFSPASPMKINASACAVVADGLISWLYAPDDKDKVPTRESMIWTGQDNQYEIRGKAWVQTGAQGSPLAPMQDGPTDLETWERKLGSEQSPRAAPVKFATEGASHSSHPSPTDFAVAGEGGKASVGADPAFVGPEGKAFR
jgi:serine/threonine-protein kinase